MGLNKALAFSCMALTLACAGAAKADTFSTGQFVTYVQGDWAQGGVANSLLAADYNTVYASTSEVLIVGVVGVPGQFNMAFTGEDTVAGYLPFIGTPAALTASFTNPTSTGTGIFGGDVVALKLNVDFSSAGFLSGTSSIPFGDLVLTNFPGVTGSVTSLNGLTVSQFLLDVADPCLAGDACPAGLDNVAMVTNELNSTFDRGTVSTFADDHLALPSSVTPAPEPSSLVLLAPALASLAFLRRPHILRI